MQECKTDIKSHTVSHIHTRPLFSLAGTCVCQLEIFQNFWQLAVWKEQTSSCKDDQIKWGNYSDYRSETNHKFSPACPLYAHCGQLLRHSKRICSIRQTLMVGTGAGAAAWEGEEEKEDEGCCRSDPDEELIGASGGYSSVLSKRLVMVVSTQFVRTAPKTQSSSVNREHGLASDTRDYQTRKNNLSFFSPQCHGYIELQENWISMSSWQNTKR